MSAVSQTDESPLSPGVTRRVVLLCLGLALIFGYVIPTIDVKFSNTFLGAAHLPPGAIAALLMLVLVVNPLLKLISRRSAFSRNEILTVYISCLFSCLVPGHGGENFFVPNLIGPFYYASPENRWWQFLHGNLKPWFTPALNSDGAYRRGLVEHWYTKLGDGVAIPWAQWLLPLLAWSAFVLATYVMLGCLSVILRAQWSEREALAFPLLRLPLELTEDVDADGPYGKLGKFFRNPAMWVGFGIAVFIQTLNGLNTYFPSVPPVPLGIDTLKLFSEPPWNQIGWTPIKIWPVVVGITFLLTSEVSFSLWFFYWFVRLQLIAAYLFGFAPNTLPSAAGNTAGARTFDAFQQVGCYLAYAAIVVYTAREHLFHVARRGLGRAAKGEEEGREALSYPAAFWGFILSFAFIIGWTALAGVRLDIALALWLAYLVIAIGLSRLVVEGGVLFVQQGWAPLSSIAQLVGSGPGTLLPTASIVPASFIQSSLMTDMRGFLMPSFVQSFKLAHDRKIKARPLLALIASVTAVTFFMSLYMNVKMGYQNGGLALNSWFASAGAKLPAANAQSLIDGTQGVSIFNWFWLAVGVLLTYGMTVARSRFVWFPLHPLGYLMCLTYPMNNLWFSIFLGWMCKSLIQRFGGNDGYRAAQPAFLGLALGDITMMLVWLIINGMTGHMNHQLMPG